MRTQVSDDRKRAAQIAFGRNAAPHAMQLAPAPYRRGCGFERRRRPRWLAATVLIATFSQPIAAADDLAQLGKRLFFDVNLSAARNQSCATCHRPERAFTDERRNPVNGAASLGSDGRSLGDRNAPSLSYAALVPLLTRAVDGEIHGGLFHDGRAADLEAQALEPILNPLEMAMPDALTVVRRLREQPLYVEAFTKHFGRDIFNRPRAAYTALGNAIAEFERGPPFLPFDSRYDRYLAGDYVMSAEEELGRTLYFSDLTNCMQCHLLRSGTVEPHEPFSDHRYHNIGLPRNAVLRRANGRGENHVDLGLAAHPQADATHAAGKFRTPSLRNVAVTAPYMHNGVFQKLETAIQFYNHYIVHNDAVAINPETGRPWGRPEVEENMAFELLRQGQPLDKERIGALIAFLRTLTDRRYEHLLAPARAPEEVYR